jgi:hypothetical protein
VPEAEGKRAAVKDAIEGGRRGEAGRAQPDAPSPKSRSFFVSGLTLADICQSGASLALPPVGLPVQVYSGWVEVRSQAGEWITVNSQVPVGALEKVR